MIEAPIPDDEAKRLALLKACNIIYTPAEEAFDDIARLAAEICGTEIALITLVDADYQWFKAKVGVAQEGTPRDLSFCGHCITGSEPLVVHDTHVDRRFADNPLVTGEPHIRFYAGVPLLVEEGSSVGALSVASREVRTLTAKQLDSLRRLARQISRELRLRRDLDHSIPPPSVEGPVVKPGDVLSSRWQVVRPLGEGNVGTVFEANDRDGTRVALKLLRPEWARKEEVVERFAREARVLMRLKTPHVGRLLDVGNLEPSQGGLPFLVLEYLEGTDLDRLVADRGRIPYRTAFEWCADACEGVAEAHEMGVVHRDLKPSNVFLANGAGEQPVVKVLDFGIAAGEPGGGTKITRVDTMIGSPAYMSPEQMLAASDVDPRSDVWSMGALLYEVITGAIPFPGETELQMFAATMTRPPAPLRALIKDAIPDAVDQVVRRCLQKKREDRFASIRELADALRETRKY
jgi:serine/threonine-protein kinase